MEHRKLRVLDLFSGIGGFTLGLERTGGFETVAFCEIEAFPRAVLKKNWPEVPCHEDVRKLTGEQVGPIDLICGGYPCQPFSVAGQRNGASDDRHLWPEFMRLVDELRPTWVIGENVAGHISMGLDNVLSDLENSNYTCRTFVIPACATDAPHRRHRVWTVAYAGRSGVDERRGFEVSFTEGEKLSGNERHGVQVGSDKERYVSPRGLEGFESNGSERAAYVGPDSPVKPCLGGVVYGVSEGLHGHISRLETISAWPPEPSGERLSETAIDRSPRIKALGNAVVPQIPEMLGYAILDSLDSPYANVA